jgi:hypothetical protein
MKTLEEVETELASMLDPLDIPGNWTPRERDAYETKRAVLDARIRTVRMSKDILAQVEPRIAFDTKWRDHLREWLAILGERLLALGDARTDIDRARVIALKLSIMRIHRGLNFNEMLPGHLPLDDLLHEAGFVPRDAVARANGDAWYGTLPVVEQRLAELTARRDDAQTRLDAALRVEG